LHVGDAHASLVGGKVDCFEILRLRQHSLRKKLRAAVESKSDEFEQRRQLVQRKAQRSLLVAVIGYTNAGKTTLIKRFVTGVLFTFICCLV
jgi:50S ribosomal subunit-associated GTPase HflX